jgi:hypothetical protein
MIKSIYAQSESHKWSLLDDGKYEGLDCDFMPAMYHTASQCLLCQKHTDPPIGRATRDIRYWDMIIKLLGVRDPTNDLLNYYLSKSGVENSAFDHNLPLEACIHQINNTRSKLKNVIKQATQLRAKFEVDLATAVVGTVHQKRTEVKGGYKNN